MSDEPLTEIRDLLEKLLEQSRAMATKYDTALREHPEALVEQRRAQRIVMIPIVAVILLLFAYVFR